MSTDRPFNPLVKISVQVVLQQPIILNLNSCEEEHVILLEMSLLVIEQT